MTRLLFQKLATDLAGAPDSEIDSVAQDAGKIPNEAGKIAEAIKVRTKAILSFTRPA